MWTAVYLCLGMVETHQVRFSVVPKNVKRSRIRVSQTLVPAPVEDPPLTAPRGWTGRDLQRRPLRRGSGRIGYARGEFVDSP